MKTIAVRGVLSSSVRKIYLEGVNGSLYNFGKDSVKLHYGELQDVVVNGTTLVIQAKITSAISNEAAKEQSFINVTDLICEQNCEVFHEVQYWATMETTDCEDIRFISFDVPENIITQIKSGAIYDNMLEFYVVNLWINPRFE